jgi:hypothetical protein
MAKYKEEAWCMRLSADRNDSGYQRAACIRGAIRDVLFNGVSIVHTKVITADDDLGVVMRYMTWPHGEHVVVDDGEDRYAQRVTMHGKVEIILNDGWKYENETLTYYAQCVP